MNWLIWTGVALTVTGLVTLVYCIVAAVSAKRAGLGDEALRARLQRIVAINMAALLISALGLMSVVIAVFLGG